MVSLTPCRWAILTGFALAFSSNVARADLLYANPPEVGSLPIITTAFVNSATGDIYQNLYVFSLFDTGSTKVFLDTTTASTLGLQTGNTPILRLNGLSAIDPVTLDAPIGPGQAQAEFSNIGIKVTGGLDIPLMGAPVTNQAVATIDYTNTITRGPYAYLGGQDVSGPDITFYSGTNTPGYTPAIELSLDPWGTPLNYPDGSVSGYWYLMYGVSFTQGSNTVTSASSGDLDSTANKFMYDTGTDVTLIVPALATSLGLDLNNPDFQLTVGSTPLPGFYLDSISMAGVGGSYIVTHVPVAVDSSLGGATAIIGSNLFNDTELLFDGPDNTLGVGVATSQVPEPASAALLLGAVLTIGLLARRRIGIR